MIPRPEDLLVAGGLPQAWQHTDCFTVLDLDFGSGAVFEATLNAWRADPRRPQRLRYAALMPTCPSRDEWAQGARRAELAPGLIATLHEAWPWAIEGVHRLVLEDGAVQLTLATGNALELLPGLVPRADAVLIPPSGAALPAPLIREACSALATGAFVAAHTGDALLAALHRAGMAVAHLDEPLSGLIRAWRRHGPGPVCSPPASDARRALVVGSGLAGSAMAFALAQRGWSVRRLSVEADAEAISRGCAMRPSDSPAAPGSWQAVLAQYPSVTPDDAPISRLTRAALALSCGPYSTDAMRRVGRLQLMEPQAARAAAAGLPSEWVEVLDSQAASEKAGRALSQGGLWLPQAGCADPRALCAAWTLPGIEVHQGAPVAQVKQTENGWQCTDAAGHSLGEAPVLVVAAGARGMDIEVQACAMPHRLGDLFGDAGWQVRAARATLAVSSHVSLGRCVMGGEGHAIPMGDDRWLLGPADGGWQRLLTQMGVHESNLELTPGALGTRLSSRDHLPLAGPVPDPMAIARQREALQRNDRLPIPTLAGLWVCMALGGRGLLWSVLCAELIASRLALEPMPLARPLVRALDPSRFLRRGWRRE